MQTRRLAAGLLLAALFSSAPCQAQSSAGSDNPMIPLCAPYALYPDTLLAQVLAASTYPDQVMAASVWCTAHAGTQGSALASAMNSQPWDASVKALCTFPDVLQKMTSDMNSTTALGQDFINDKASVMDCIQGLRSQAQTMGALQTTPQQTVVTNGDTIQINPASPDTIYVPTYDPTAFYGSTAAYGAGALAFGTGVALGAAYTNNYGAFNWANHGMYTGSAVYHSGGAYTGAYGGTSAWGHNYGYASGVNGAAYHTGSTGVYRGPAGNTSVYHQGSTGFSGYGGSGYHSSSAFATTAGGGYAGREASRGYSSMGGGAAHFGGFRR